MHAAARASAQDCDFLMLVASRWRFSSEALPRIRTAAPTVVMESPEFERRVRRLGVALRQ